MTAVLTVIITSLVGAISLPNGLEMNKAEDFNYEQNVESMDKCREEMAMWEKALSADDGNKFNLKCLATSNMDVDGTEGNCSEGIVYTHDSMPQGKAISNMQCVIDVEPGKP